MANRKTEVVVSLFIGAALFIFLYLIYQIGIINFDRQQYHAYYICFSDATGLKKKDDVKIAGVKVGNIENLTLDPEKSCVKIKIAVQAQFILRANATAFIRQESFLGNKYIEIIPGSLPATPLAPESHFATTGRPIISVDTVVDQVQTIATHIHDVTSDLQNALKTPDGSSAVRNTVGQLNDMITNLNALTKSVDALVKKNESNLENTIAHLAALVADLRQTLPSVVADIKNVANKIEHQTAPLVEKNITKAIDQFEQTNTQVQQIVQKINNGQGCLGKLLHDEQAYNDVKVTVKCLNDSFSFFNKVKFGFDTHTEAMLGPVADTDFNDIKGYFDAYVWPCDNLFVLGGLVYRRSGIVKHDEIFATPLAISDNKTALTLDSKKAVRECNRFVWNLQLGGKWSNGRMRAGLFENTLGAGLDLEFPFYNNVGLVTTFEAYDFNGSMRINDTRPHLKWLNRLFFNDYLYFTFGIDDFISKNNKNFFLGAGFCLGYVW